MTLECKAEIGGSFSLLVEEENHKIVKVLSSERSGKTVRVRTASALDILNYNTAAYESVHHGYKITGDSDGIEGATLILNSSTQYTTGSFKLAIWSDDSGRKAIKTKVNCVRKNKTN